MPLSSPLVLAFGDSLVAGYGLPLVDGLAAQLERRLRPTRPDARVVPAGRAGDTSLEALRRLPGVLSRLARRPDLAIVQLGPNDVLRQVPPAATRANLEAILLELGRCGVPVLLTSVTPPPFLLPRAEAYLGLHEALARAHGAGIVPFFPPGVLGHPDMVLRDRVHPNARAIAAVTAAMLPTVERLLEG
jgi:acyl-CoA thioesterase-1